MSVLPGIQFDPAGCTRVMRMGVLYRRRESFA
jgi:hypothetical protein